MYNNTLQTILWRIFFPILWKIIIYQPLSNKNGSSPSTPCDFICIFIWEQLYSLSVFKEDKINKNDDYNLFTILRSMSVCLNVFHWPVLIMTSRICSARSSCSPFSLRAFFSLVSWSKICVWCHSVNHSPIRYNLRREGGMLLSRAYRRVTRG